MNISITAEPIFHLGSLPVTNSILVALIAMVILIGGAWLMTRSLKAVPGRVQGVGEIAIESLLNLIDGVTQDKKQTQQFFPFIATIFFFVLTVNWFGLIPGVGTVGLKEVHEGKDVIVPFFRSASADLNFTIALAIMSVFATQFVGLSVLGLGGYVKKFIDFKKPLMIPLGILEIVSEFTKLISFSFRLFGNVFAGEVLLAVIMFLVPYLVPLPFLVLELFVGFIQAVIFSMLTLVFMKIATVEAAH